MSRRLFALLALFAAALAAAPAPARAAGPSLRLLAPGRAPVVLAPALEENNTAWYDAQSWLLQFPGDVSREDDDRRLTYKKAGRWAALKTEPPYAMRDGRPLAGAEPPLFRGGKLLVSERFLRRTGPEFLDEAFTVERSSAGPARRVVLDPARGGADPGASGQGGAKEKDAVLAVAVALADALEARGYEVHLTRREDADLDPARRAAVANYWRADLFLVLSAAGAARPEARGFELFHPPAAPEGTDPASWRGGQAPFAAESRRLAQALRAALGRELAGYDRGARELASPALDAAACPAALASLGNLARPEEARLFTDPEGRARLAGALADGIDLFFGGTTPAGPE